MTYNGFTLHCSLYHGFSGIWADNSDDEGETSGHRGFGGASRAKGRKKFDTSAPISFVAGGVQQAGKKGKKGDEKSKRKEEEGDDDDDNEEEEGDKKRRFGSSSRFVVYFGCMENLSTWGSIISGHDWPQILCDFCSYSDSDDGGRQGFGSKSNTTDIDGDIAGLRRKKYEQSTTLISKGVGNWEKHTKGIGAKLLLQVCCCLI